MTRQNILDCNSMDTAVSQAADGGLRAVVQHFWGKTKAAGAQSETASLRDQIRQTRARFMDSLAIGKPDADAAEKYTNAVKQYRIAIFAGLDPREFGEYAGNRRPSQRAKHKRPR